jgi:tetratricopeptide (TPR) repeat protein
MPPRSAAAQPRKRRWQVTPPLTSGPEPLEAGGVLSEFAGDTGFLLWQTVRDVSLWAARPDEREGLFSSTAPARRRDAIEASEGLPAGVRELLLKTAAVLTEDADGDEVAASCGAVGDWAEAKGLLATALAFYQAAALASPRDAALAYRVGQVARRRAEYARAETWFRRTVALARQGGDRESYTVAFLGLGNLYRQRGALVGARNHHVRALRASRRHSMRELQGAALHNLCVVAIESGHPRRAQDYARKAYDAYGPRHEKLPVLAHDVAYFWSTRGDFARALPIFRAVLTWITRPEERLTVFANIARAGGGLGDRKAFEEGWSSALEMIEETAVRETSAQAWLDLAHGAASIGDWKRAESSAERALEQAQERREARTRAQAEELLEAAHRHQHVVPFQAKGRRSDLSDDAEGLQRDLLESLRDMVA